MALDEIPDMDEIKNRLDNQDKQMHEMATSVKNVADSVSTLTESVNKLIERDIRLQEREDRQQEFNNRIAGRVEKLESSFYKVRDIVMRNSFKTDLNFTFIQKYGPWIIVGAIILMAYLRKLPFLS
ncbi:TMhelix containing protein [Vibrio phage vB_VpM-pA2SJ1]|uniref:TMhelix containing protein n=1 Tax=Vibrio phage vB_VpM-pA2SJ1 TaxID=3095964 RepID=A0AAX4J5C3_9CAUD